MTEVYRDLIQSFLANTTLILRLGNKDFFPSFLDLHGLNNESVVKQHTKRPIHDCLYTTES